MRDKKVSTPDLCRSLVQVPKAPVHFTYLTAAINPVHMFPFIRLEVACFMLLSRLLVVIHKN